MFSPKISFFEVAKDWIALTDVVVVTLGLGLRVCVLYARCLLSALSRLQRGIGLYCTISYPQTKMNDENCPGVLGTT